MRIIYSDEQFDPVPDDFAVFLAGPTPRSDTVKSWRPEAIETLKEVGYNGVVYVPERKNGWTKDCYDDQINWEWDALHRCANEELNGLIIFWIPRNLTSLPGFTTNVEFGYYARSLRIVYGRPDDAPGCSYLDRLYRRHHVLRQPENNFKSLAMCAYEEEKWSKL